MMAETCHELGITIVADSPLGRGLSSYCNAFFDMLSHCLRCCFPMTSQGFRGHCKSRCPHGKENCPTFWNSPSLKEIKTKYTATLARVSLAWLLAQGPGTTPIPDMQESHYQPTTHLLILFVPQAEPTSRQVKLTHEAVS